MNREQIQPVCIQDHRLAAHGSAHQKPLCTFSALSGYPESGSYHQNITPVHHLLICTFIKFTGDHRFWQQRLKRNPVLLHCLDLHHSRGTFQRSRST